MMRPSRLPPLWRLSAPMLGSLALALALGGCGLFSPDPQDEIIFSHGTHAAQGVACLSCHGRALENEDGDAILPTQTECQQCHEQEPCRFCHTEPGHPGGYSRPPDEILFAHTPHLEQQPNCMACHRPRDGGTEIASFRPVIPNMAGCVQACHAEELDALRCDRCHSDLHRYRMDDLDFVRHAPGFLRRHGGMARADEALCTACHEPSHCSNCHAPSTGIPLELVEPPAALRDFVHRGDFISRHPMEARLERGTCQRCHGVAFCEGCHEARGASPAGGGSDPHPPGWLDPTSVDGHARAARRDLLSCATCHQEDAERTCAGCHRVGGAAGNPHPPGFGAGLDPLAHGLCRTCHGGAP
ncbi:MAG: hypothetical protein OEY14_12495 [Myxococcales bacterium]|nr:hypothetical protein [Myxococcales bacterium]